MSAATILLTNQPSNNYCGVELNRGVKKLTRVALLKRVVVSEGKIRLGTTLE